MKSVIEEWNRSSNKTRYVLLLRQHSSTNGKSREKTKGREGNLSARGVGCHGRGSHHGLIAAATMTRGGHHSQAKVASGRGDFASSLR